MIEEILNFDRRLRIDYKNLNKNYVINKELYSVIDNFILEYARYYNLKVEDIVSHYNSFLHRYTSNIRDFIRTGKYPNQLGIFPKLDRIEYDISLILSPVVTIPRYRIFDNIYKRFEFFEGNNLVIGIGSGLELKLLEHFKCNCDAYDLNISNFVKTKFSKFNLSEEFFTGQKQNYNNIVAIELLEHINKPYDFIRMCYKSLESNGMLFITTAKNIPQIDHLYNFKNESEFESIIREIGFEISEKDVIPHNNTFYKKLDANNVWYSLIKT